MAKSVANSGHCKALNRLQNDRGEIATQKYPEMGQKRFNDESSAWMISQITDRARPRPSCVIMLVMFRKTLVVEVGWSESCTCCFNLYAVKPREKSSGMTAI